MLTGLDVPGLPKLISDEMKCAPGFRRMSNVGECSELQVRKSHEMAEVGGEDEDWLDNEHDGLNCGVKATVSVKAPAIKWGSNLGGSRGILPDGTCGP